MFRYVPIVCGLVLIVFLGVVQGIWSDRWSDEGIAAAEFAARLANVPMQVGNWEGVDQSEEGNERALKVAGAVGNLSRVFTNKVTGQTVSVYIICGHFRKITAHTPNRCYPASGFSSVGEQTQQPIAWDDSTAEFYTKSFRKESIEGIQFLRVFWAWSQNGKWQAPNHPNLEFAGVRALYKLYLISPVQKRNEQPLESAAAPFAKEFMPELNRALFPTTTSPETPAVPAEA
jgi:hypothetical protein